MAAKAVVASEPVVSKAEKKRSKEVESVSEEVVGVVVVVVVFGRI